MTLNETLLAGRRPRECSSRLAACLLVATRCAQLWRHTNRDAGNGSSSAPGQATGSPPVACTLTSVRCTISTQITTVQVCTAAACRLHVVLVCTGSRCWEARCKATGSSPSLPTLSNASHRDALHTATDRYVCVMAGTPLCLSVACVGRDREREHINERAHLALPSEAQDDSTPSGRHPRRGTSGSHMLY